jgi:hypothetical protein
MQYRMIKWLVREYGYSAFFASFRVLHPIPMVDILRPPVRAPSGKPFRVRISEADRIFH